MRTVRVCEYLFIVVVNEDKEEYETDETTNECQKSEEKPFAGANAIRFGVVSHLAAGHADMVILLAPVPEDV